MAAGGLHISISAEKVTEIGGLIISNSMLTSLVVSGLMIAFALYFNATYRPSHRPSGIHNFIESLFEMMYGLIQSVTNSHTKTNRFFPLLVTFFLFITLNNWFGLLPGVGSPISIIVNEDEEEIHETASTSFLPQAHANEVIPEEEDHVTSTDAAPPAVLQANEVHVTEIAEEAHGPKLVPLFRAGTADLNTTIALAVVSQLFAQFYGFSYVGFGYLKKFINFSSPIMFFVGILELMGEFTKVVSYAFRLFGNIFAGEVLLAVIAFLVPVVVPMPFYGLELFVGMIQGLVFMMLSLVFFNMATISHDEH